MPAVLAEITHRAIGEELSLEVLRGTEKLTIRVPVQERQDDPFRFAHLATTETNIIRQLGILALDLDEKIVAQLPPLRKAAGIVVAAKIAGLPVPTDELEAGDLISAVNGQVVANIAAMRAMFEKMDSGSPVVIQVQRGSRLMLLSFEMP